MRLSLLIFAATFAVTGAKAAAPEPAIDSIWPQCRGWETQIESWQWITPEDLTAEAARDAIAGLSAVEGKEVDGEAAMIVTINLQLVQGYALLVKAKRGVAGYSSDSIGVARQRSDIEAFCRWITTNAFPD